MALFDRNDDRGYGGRDVNRGRGGGFLDRVQNTFRGRDTGVSDEHLRWDYENRSIMDTGPGYGGGTGRGWHGGHAPYMDREGSLHQRNSWSDGAWTADAGERADREWNLGNRGVRGDYDRDLSPFQAGWRAGGMHGGGMSGGMGMNRGMSGMGRGREDDRGWNPGGGDWGHRGYGAGGMDRDWNDRGPMNRGGFLDRAQNAVRRGWDQLEDRFDRDDDDRGRMHLGGSSMRGGTGWAGRYDRDWHEPSDIRAYRDEEGHYGLTHVRGMRGGGMGLDRGGMDYDRGYRSREQTDAGDPFGDRQNRTPIRVTGNRGGLNRYDNGYDRGGRDWF